MTAKSNDAAILASGKAKLALIREEARKRRARLAAKPSKARP